MSVGQRTVREGRGAAGRGGAATAVGATTRTTIRDRLTPAKRAPFIYTVLKCFKNNPEYFSR